MGEVGVWVLAEVWAGTRRGVTGCVVYGWCGWGVGSARRVRWAGQPTGPNRAYGERSGNGQGRTFGARGHRHSRQPRIRPTVRSEKEIQVSSDYVTKDISKAAFPRWFMAYENDWD